MPVRIAALSGAWLVALTLLAGCSGSSVASIGASLPSSRPSASSPAITNTAPATLPAATEAPTMTARPTDIPSGAVFTLVSPAFEPGTGIPSRFTCDGDDVSPPLAWSGAPDGTVAYLLTMRDPDARDFLHWIAWNIPASATGLDRGASGDVPGEAGEGKTDFGGSRTGYRGPCPPSGTHHYTLTLYALPMALADAEATPSDRLEQAAATIALAKATLTGTYRRQ